MKLGWACELHLKPDRITESPLNPWTTLSLWQRHQTLMWFSCGCLGEHFKWVVGIYLAFLTEMKEYCTFTSYQLKNELKKELANVPNIPEAIGKCKWFALIWWMLTAVWETLQLLLYICFGLMNLLQGFGRSLYITWQLYLQLMVSLLQEFTYILLNSFNVNSYVEVKDSCMQMKTVHWHTNTCFALFLNINCCVLGLCCCNVCNNFFSMMLWAYVDQDNVKSRVIMDNSLKCILEYMTYISWMDWMFRLMILLCQCLFHVFGLW